ncbi:hypothetical protein B9Z55_012194 [Caenorhabditis nigoni]|nr:hypothetical protein B9Z55_012194 [Caenorhabditis nigoni]
MFATNEIFVCLHEKDGSKYPYSAKVMAIKKIGSTQFYLIHYRGFKATTDICIQVGEEAGKMFKGSLKEYAEKFHVAISPDAWEAERKCKRKATDDLDRSFVKKEKVVEENVYRKVYAVKRRKLREDSEEATTSDVSRRFRGDSEATNSEVKGSRISKDKENKAKNFKQQNPEAQVEKIPKGIPNDQNEIPEGQETSKNVPMDQTEENLDKEEEVQNLKPANPEAQIQETQIRMDQAKGDTPNVLEEIQNLPESPKKSGPIEKLPDSGVAQKVQDPKDLKVEVAVSKDAVPKKRNNPGYYIPKNDPEYNERMSVLRARYAGELDELKLTDELGKILVDDYNLVHSKKKTPKVPAEWTVMKILDEYKKSKDNDADSYDVNVLSSMVPSYLDKHFRSLLYKVEIPRYEKRVNDEFISQNLVFKASEHCGFIHLLRLITKIHKFVMMDNSVHNLEHTRTILMNFMTFLDSNKHIFYKNEQDYMNA